MKTIWLPLIILMKVILAGSVMSQTIIMLTFTANTDTLHQPLDSIVVENFIRGVDTVLYYPDTVLELDSKTSVFDSYRDHKRGLILYPSFPNPFTYQTTMRFFLPERDRITIRTIDLLGREIAVHQQTLPQGEHSFTFYSGSDRYYLLVIETSHERGVQKLISLGGEGTSKIEYLGYNPFLAFRLGKSKFLWAPGDQMRFAGYATLTGNISVSDTIVDDPVASTLFNFQFTEPYPPGYVHCDLANFTAIVDVINPTTGKTWMDRNLGASQIATGNTDALAYGDLYQWGRFADGHHCRTSANTTTLSATNLPGHGNFIVALDAPYDWRSPQNHNLWQGINGVNNPCPSGYRLPTRAELNSERLSWSSNNDVGAFASPLKLPLAGFRANSNGSLYGNGDFGHYWASAISGFGSSYLYFNSTNAGMSEGTFRAYGFSVRCVKD